MPAASDAAVAASRGKRRRRYRNEIVDVLAEEIRRCFAVSPNRIGCMVQLKSSASLKTIQKCTFISACYIYSVLAEKCDRKVEL